MITLDNSLLNQIFESGKNFYPEECCGALLGHTENDEQVVEKIFVIHNSQSQNRSHRFLISPDQYKAAEKIADENHLELLGFYHSHPDHTAKPSEFDLNHAWPWFIYLIFSVNNGEPGDFTAWLLADNREKFEQQDIQVEESIID